MTYVRIAAGCIAMSMAIPAEVRAELTFDGDITLGYGNVGLTHGGYVLGHLRGTYSHQFDNGYKLEFQTILNARTWQRESGHIDNNYVDYRFELDMQRYGKITAATFLPEKNRPIADGDLFNEGSIGVSYGTQSAYRNIFARKPIRANGRQFKATNDLYVAYENQISKLGVMATVGV